MERDAVSSASLKLIDSALFTVALDDTAADSEAELSRQMLSGDGRNRWFDKSFTLIVLPNGMAGVNFEHAWGDGVAVLRYVNEVCFSGAQVRLPPWHLLCFVLGWSFRIDSCGREVIRVVIFLI